MSGMVICLSSYSIFSLFQEYRLLLSDSAGVVGAVDRLIETGELGDNQSSSSGTREQVVEAEVVLNLRRFGALNWLKTFADGSRGSAHIDP